MLRDAGKVTFRYHLGTGGTRQEGVIMSSNREREAWTKFIEERERKAKRSRTRKPPQPTPEEMEAALDDLVRDSKPSD
jgi:hypothetical protein